MTLAAARAAGLVGRKRVLDSTPLYDAVATMDTVTLIRSAIRGLLQVADSALEAKLRARLRRDDDYASAGKPVCDYDDPVAREALVDGLAWDAYALLAFLDGGTLGPAVDKAAELLATVVGQDLDRDAGDGVFRIARRVAKDRVISTVDPQTRHGHKTSARGFDGYKGHIAIDPDSEIITATEVTAGNAGDADPAADLLAADLPGDGAQDIGDRDVDGPAIPVTPIPLPAATPATATTKPSAAPAQDASDSQDRPAVYGDAAYGAGALLATLEAAHARIFTKVQPPTAPDGRFAKDRFDDRSGREHGHLPERGHRADPPRPRAVAAPRCSARPAPSARWRPAAPARPPAAPSPSAATRPNSPAPAPPRTTRPGSPSTGPPARRWNARSAT